MVSDPKPAVPARYSATIQQAARWGPWAWLIHFTHGCSVIEPSSSAWSRKRAEAKARRLIRKWQARDDRRDASRCVLEG